MMTSRKVRFLLSTYRMCGCRVARLQTSVGPQQKHLSKARQKAKEDRRDGDIQRNWSILQPQMLNVERSQGSWMFMIMLINSSFLGSCVAAVE